MDAPGVQDLQLTRWRIFLFREAIELLEVEPSGCLEKVDQPMLILLAGGSYGLLQRGFHMNSNSLGKWTHWCRRVYYRIFLSYT